MIEQGSQSWHDEKLGVITGTRAYELMSSNITRRTLLATLIREIVTADAKHFDSKRLQTGRNSEPEAVSYYSMMNNVEVTDQTAYIESTLHPMFACSPDGLIGDDGGYEGKSLDDENHIKMLLGATPDKAYVMQCHWCMYITARQWWDLHYHCETLPDSMKSHVIRIGRDETIMAEMDTQAKAMLADLTTFLNKHGLGGLL